MINNNISNMNINNMNNTNNDINNKEIISSDRNEEKLVYHIKELKSRRRGEEKDLPPEKEEGILRVIDEFRDKGYKGDNKIINELCSVLSMELTNTQNSNNNINNKNSFNYNNDGTSSVVPPKEMVTLRKSVGGIVKEGYKINEKFMEKIIHRLTDFHVIVVKTNFDGNLQILQSFDTTEETNFGILDLEEEENGGPPNSNTIILQNKITPTLHPIKSSPPSLPSKTQRTPANLSSSKTVSSDNPLSSSPPPPPAPPPAPPPDVSSPPQNEVSKSPPVIWDDEVMEEDEEEWECVCVDGLRCCC